MPRQHLRRHGVTVAFAILATIGACSDSALPSGPNASRPAGASGRAAGTRDGSWTGFTAEGNPVRFTIDGGVVEDLSIVVHLAGDCDTDVYRAFVNSAVDAFAVPIRLGNSANELTITAQFADDNAAVAGAASLNYVGVLTDGGACNASGTTSWTATRNW